MVGRYMPRIRAKYKKGNPYYYVVTSIRCGPNNSPREKILEYIGPEEKLMSLALEGYNARNRASPEPESDELYANLSFKSYVWFGAQKSGKVIFKSRTKAKYKKMQDKTVSLKLVNDVLFLSVMFYCSDFRQ